MFGFGRLASYDYFTHLEKGLAARFADAGEELSSYVVDVAPTASLRRIHFIGHSTGGLDARLGTDATKTRHVDWMKSGSRFDARSFDGMLDAIARGMLSR